MPLIFSNNILDVTEYSGNLDDSYIERGQIYNLDDNKKIWFQYNPADFEDEKVINWAEIKGIGSDYQYNYLNQSERSFEVTLIFMAYSNYESIRANGVGRALAANGMAVDFSELYNELDSWNERRDDTGIPSKIMFIIAGESYIGFIRQLRKRILLQYPNGKIRRASLTFQFQEWKGIQR